MNKNKFTQNNAKILLMCYNMHRKNQKDLSEKKPNNIDDYEHYIEVLEKNNVPNARENVKQMFILDYLIMNIDRHMKNFGVIRNVNTLEWISTTPIFDNGESMQCEN